MHLGNGALTPDCALFTFGAATLGLGIASASLRHERLTAEKAIAAGGLTAAVFAAQMFNVQVVPLGVSGHFLGGTLLAWTLGANWGAILMSLVLLVQAIVLGDGGLSAWGANVINMALLPAGLVWSVRWAMSSEESSLVRGLSLAGVSASAVIGAALLVILEVVFARGFQMVDGLGTFAGAMLVNHLVIAIAEAALTVGIVGLLTGWEFSFSESGNSVRAAAAIGLALVLVPLAISFGSPLPDGYEAAVAAGSLEDVMAIQSAGSVAAIEAGQKELAAAFTYAVPSETGLAILATVVVGMFGTLLTMISMPREEAAVAKG